MLLPKKFILCPFPVFCRFVGCWHWQALTEGLWSWYHSTFWTKIFSKSCIIRQLLLSLHPWQTITKSLTTMPFLMPSSARKVLPNAQEPKRQPTRFILVRFFRMLAKRQRWLKANWLLLQRCPGIVQHLPLHAISSFLCITPQMLSKIRKNIFFGAQK